MAMDTVQFGRMGDRVSRLGFGAWAIGSKSYGEVAPSDAIETLEAYAGAGGTFIDTARGYGKSEEIIGEFLRGRGDRSNLFLCSKTPAAPADVRRELETSLSLLGINSLDLYYLHNPPSDPREMENLLDAFIELKEEGLIRGIGASIKGPNVTAETQQLCRQYIATGSIDAIQLIFSVFRQDNREVFDEAKAAGVALVGRTVLENGFLTGKYEPGHRFPEGDHRARWPHDKLDRALEAASELERFRLETPSESLAQMAIRFAYEEAGLTTLIVGARTASQVRGNIQAVTTRPGSTEWREQLVDRFSGDHALGNL